MKIKTWNASSSNGQTTLIKKMAYFLRILLILIEIRSIQEHIFLYKVSFSHKCRIFHVEK